jgi:tRNA1(Val) A37 N6-methylase TrmN6
MSEPLNSFTEDGFLGGQLRLRQPRTGHRAGHDAILLAAATSAQPGARVVDFGAGVGAAGLALARRVSDVAMVLVERDRTLAELARENAALNRLPAEVVVLDIESGPENFAAAGLGPDSADGVLMNPPFNDRARHRPSPDKSRETAHVATATTLANWIHAARRILKSGGVLTLIWRADGLADILAALDRGFGSVSVLPVHGDPATPAIRVLVRAIKGGRAPAAIYPGLMLNPGLILKPGVMLNKAPEPAAGTGNPADQEVLFVREVLAGRAILPLAKL